MLYQTLLALCSESYNRYFDDPDTYNSYDAEFNFNKINDEVYAMLKDLDDEAFTRGAVGDILHSLERKLCRAYEGLPEEYAEAIIWNVIVTRMGKDPWKLSEELYDEYMNAKKNIPIGDEIEQSYQPRYKKGRRARRFDDAIL